MKILVGWHFSSNGKLLDGRKIKVGEWMGLRKKDWQDAIRRERERYTDPEAAQALKKLMNADAKQQHPVMCCIGFHACRQARHALSYTYSRDVKMPTAERVAIRGKISERDDKFVGLERCVTEMLSPNKTRRVLLLYCCRNVRHEVRYSNWGEKFIAKEMERLNQVEAYLLGEGDKPKTHKDDGYCTNLIHTVVEGSKYMTAIQCVNQYCQCSPKGTLARLLLKAMKP
jgi:hypothetical protein